jgi:hypothetical protein
LYQKEKEKEGKSEIFDLISWCRFLRPKWENKQRPDYNNKKRPFYIGGKGRSNPLPYV